MRQWRIAFHADMGPLFQKTPAVLYLAVGQHQTHQHIWSVEKIIYMTIRRYFHSLSFQTALHHFCICSVSPTSRITYSEILWGGCGCFCARKWEYGCKPNIANWFHFGLHELLLAHLTWPNWSVNLETVPTLLEHPACHHNGSLDQTYNQFSFSLAVKHVMIHPVFHSNLEKKKKEKEDFYCYVLIIYSTGQGKEYYNAIGCCGLVKFR